MKHAFFKFIPAIFALSLIGCGSDSGSSASEESSSSESSSSVSSSSYSNRLDVLYADTLTADTLRITPRDSLFSSCKLFLGELPQGSRIRVIAKKTGGDADSLFVREEAGEILYPEYFWTDANGDTTYNTQNLYAKLDTADYSSVIFVTTANSGFYYVDIPRISTDRDSSFSIRIAAEIQSGYYRYVGDTTRLELSPGDTIRGVFLLGNSSDSALAGFSASTGKSINIKAFGKSLDEIVLRSKSSTLASGLSVNEQILPEKDEEYSVAIRPQKFPNYQTGYYGYFTIETTSRDLEKGEYFALPDSIQKVGDTLTIVRPKNDAAKYYLRQEQYVWLAKLSKGDTLQIYHSIEGYFSDASYPATYTILDSEGDSISTITETRPQFIAPKDGDYYLHYIRLNSPPQTSSQILTLHTMIQRLNYVTKFYFYDEELDKVITEYSRSLGDTLHFASLSLRTEPSDVSNLARWYMPCEDLAYIQSAYSMESCKSKGSDQLLSANNVVITENDEAIGETFHLIAESKADPRARDTITVYINE